MKPRLWPGCAKSNPILQVRRAAQALSSLPNFHSAPVFRYVAMASDVAPLQTTADGPRPQADGTPADAPDPWAKAFETLTAEERSQFEDPGCGRLAILKSVSGVSSTV